MNDHTMNAFDNDLRELASKISAMGRLDEKQIADAIGALTTGDAALAEHVITVDEQVDSLQGEIEEKAVLTLARRQPMAVDLREIVGALRISNDLERIGDYAENIAKRAVLLAGDFRINDVMLQLRRMAELALSQLSRVLKSYEGHDADEAKAVWQRDQEIDAFNNSLFRELLTHMMEDPRNITFCTHLLFCAKNIERIGDHATNIAETVYYMVQGRSLPRERPKADVTSTKLLPLSR
jgi:phosphate transport system protein